MYGFFRLDLRRYAREVSRRLSSAPNPLHDALKDTNFEDLYLAIACDHGDPDAWDCLVQRILPRVQLALDGIGVGCEDLAHATAGHLVARAPGPGGLGSFRDYSGRSSLVAWLKATALNIRRHELRSAERARKLLFERRSPHHSTSLHHNDGFSLLAQVLTDTLSSLEPRQQRVMRLYFGE
jgi:hypothetical protein